MPKVILWDADGVTLKRQAEYFSQRAAREHGLPLEALAAFFKTTYRDCQLGKTDLKDKLAALLPQWGWQGSVDEFLAYWFAGDVPDDAVLAKVREFKAQGIKCYLATDQERYRATNMRERLGFGDIFDDCFFSYEFGCSKEDPEFFAKALRYVGLPAGDVRFWDDDQKNVDVAKLVGIDARFYKGIEDLSQS